MHILSILRIVGILVMCFSCTMLLPAFVALLYGDGGGKAFIQSFVMSAIAGAILWWACHHHKEELRSREGFLIVVAFWVVMGSLGAIPFLLFEAPDLTISSAFFESFSGLTTTGATTIIGLDQLPKAILFYRQLLQWLGGMGIIVLAVAIIPLLGIGGMSLYRAEISGPVKENKMRPRITETAKTLWFIYFNSSAVNLITIVFLLISACNYALHFNAFSQLGKRNILSSYFCDPEFRFFIFIQSILVVVCFVILLTNHHFNDTLQNLEHAAFQSVSISSTAGYTTSGFDQWPVFLPILLVFASFIGGCAGSTGGGLKVVRILVLYLQGKRELNRLIHPNLVYPIKLGKRVLDERVIQSIWAFFSAYLLVFVICLLGVISCGVETFDAFNAVIACLNNVGPALGSVSSNFVSIPDEAKWILTLAMVCGRLEIFSLLVLFTPAFWKS